MVKLFTVGKLRKSSGWTWQTLPKTVFCKVIAVPKTTSVFMQYYMFAIRDFLCLIRRYNVAGPINDKSWNLNQCTSYAKVLVTTLKALENITHSYKNKTKKRRLGIAPLIDYQNWWFFLAPSLFGVRKYLYSFLHCNLIWLYIKLLLL